MIPIHRRVAKALYALAGQVLRIKVPQRTYRIDSWDDDGNITWSRAGWSRESVGLTWTIAAWSERLDPIHWEHWALVSHEPVPCSECGGEIETAKAEAP